MRRVFLAILAFSLASCSLLQREAGYPGGNMGYLSDRYALFALGQEQRVNRLLVTLALTAPFLAKTAQSSSEAKLTSYAIDELYKTILGLREALLNCPLPPSSVDGSVVVKCSVEILAKDEPTALEFETLSFAANETLYDALKQGFDNLDLKVNAKKLIALQPAEILKTILRARHLVPVMMEYLATVRDVTLIFGQTVVGPCGELKDKYPDRKSASSSIKKILSACDEVEEAFSLLVTRSRKVDSTAAAEELPIGRVYRTADNAISAGLDWKMNQWQVAGLLRITNRACRKLEALAQVDDPKFDGCAIKWSEAVPSEKAQGSGSDQATANNISRLIQDF